jgi:AsmA protein
MEMRLSADASKQDVPISLTLHAPGIPLSLLARYAALPGGAGGDLHIEMELKAKGSSAHDLAASLDGPFAATMTHGSLSNAALIELASAALQALGIEVPAQGETAIRCFGVVGSFNTGVGRFRSIALDTTYLQLDGAGQVDLGAETLALKLHPLARLSGSSVSVPVLVEGPLHAPHGRLDASGLDELGLLIDAWFGGDHPQTCSDAGLAAPPTIAR